MDLINRSHESINSEEMNFENDPYCNENGVLINNFEIQNTADLNEVEAVCAALAIQDLMAKKWEGPWSMESIQAIHREIFKEVYPWAGHFRQIDMLKGDTQFEHYKNIPSLVHQVFTRWNAVELNCIKKAEMGPKENHELDEEMKKELSVLLVTLNQIHPFREGNGRTQRVLISKILQRHNWAIKWSGIGEDAMKKALIKGAEGDFREIQKLFHLYLEPHVQISIEKNVASAAKKIEKQRMAGQKIR